MNPGSHFRKLVLGATEAAYRFPFTTLTFVIYFLPGS